MCKNVFDLSWCLCWSKKGAGGWLGGSFCGWLGVFLQQIMKMLSELHCLSSPFSRAVSRTPSPWKPGSPACREYCSRSFPDFPLKDTQAIMIVNFLQRTPSTVSFGAVQWKSLSNKSPNDLWSFSRSLSVMTPVSTWGFPYAVVMHHPLNNVLIGRTTGPDGDVFYLLSKQFSLVVVYPDYFITPNYFNRLEVLDLSSF